MTSKPVNKMLEPSKADLIRALCALEGELQAKDIVISILKTEQVRRLIHPCYNKRRWIQSQPQPPPQPPSSPSNTTNTSAHTKLSTDTIIPNNRALKSKQLQQQQNVQHQNSTTSQKQLQTFNKCVQLNISYSDPYTALLRDTYCAYDPTYDENSTKLIYNLQYQNLKNLIDHQRKVRKFLESQIADWESKYKSCWQELQDEKNKSAKYERDKMISRIEQLEQENASLRAEIASVLEQLEKEREREKSMVLCLVAEHKELICRMIEQEQHNNTLIDMLSAEQCRATEMSEDLEEESKRSLQMETEVERLTASYEKSKVLLLDKINNLENRSTKLEEENDKLRKELEAIKSKRIAQLGEGVRSQTRGSPTTPAQKKNATGTVAGAGTGTSPVFRGAPPPIPPNKPILPANALKERSKEIQQATVRAKMMNAKPITTNLSTTTSSTLAPVQGEPIVNDNSSSNETFQ